MDAHPHEPMVAEAVGPALPLHQAIAALAMGVCSLLMAGATPILLGGLVDLHRLAAPQLGAAAMAEGLTMGLSTGFASALLPPRRLRWYGMAAALVLAAFDLSTNWLSGTNVVLLRGAAGLPEGLLLWIAIGMIARHGTPERLSAILLAAMTGAQFVVVALATAWVMPVWGVSGGFWLVAIATLPAAAVALLLPNAYAPLVKPEGESAVPPPRGWAALVATVVFTASFPAAAVFLQPLAHQAGDSAEVARLALTTALLAQLIGGFCAAFLAGKVHYLPVLAAGTLVYLSCWLAMGVDAPSWLFVAANALAGFVYLVVTPFLVPMTIAADPSRRAAMMSGGAQVVAGALGPLTASFLVSDTNVHPALWLAAGLMVSGLAMIAGLYVLEQQTARHRQVAVREAEGLPQIVP